jgi:hypothetical protein
MQLFHFTSAAHLRGISQHGLTVGDVVTDLWSFRGKVGVWLTSSSTPEGHGLEGSVVDKSEFRLRVDVPDNQLLWKWSDWADAHLSNETRLLLETANLFNSDKFYIYFGWLSQDRIAEVISTKTGKEVANWGDPRPESSLAPGVPYGKRHAWHRKTMQNVRAALAVTPAGNSGWAH